MKKVYFCLTIIVIFMCSCNSNTNKDKTKIKEKVETSANYLDASMGKIENGKKVISEEIIDSKDIFDLYEIQEKDLDEAKVLDMLQIDILDEDGEKNFPLRGKDEIVFSKIPIVVYDIDNNSTAPYYSYFVFDNELNLDNGVTVNIEINKNIPSDGVQISDVIDDLFLNNILKKPNEEYICVSDGRGLALLDKDNIIISDNENVDIEVEGDCFNKLKNMGVSVKGSDILNESNLIKIKLK